MVIGAVSSPFSGSHVRNRPLVLFKLNPLNWSNIDQLAEQRRADERFISAVIDGAVYGLDPAP